MTGGYAKSKNKLPHTLRQAFHNLLTLIY